MIFTLGTNAVAQGLMVYHTGGFAPQDSATPFMRSVVVGHIIPGVPNPVLIWLAFGAATIFMLTRTIPRPADLCHRQPRARGLPFRR